MAILQHFAERSIPLQQIHSTEHKQNEISRTKNLLVQPGDIRTWPFKRAAKHMTRLQESTGRVERVVENRLAYASADNRTLSFGPNVITGYRGESFEELGITEGAPIQLEWLPVSGIVTRAWVGQQIHAGPPARKSAFQPDGTIRSGESGTPTPNDQSRDPQIELCPDHTATGSTAVFRALPKATRQFGKLLDAGILRAGDLVLAREMQQDNVSKLITDVQREGGYDSEDAKWTHAAMYLDDGASVVEATFDSVIGGGSVRLSSLDDYCQGVHSLRFRRSKFIREEREGWRVCVRAMSRLSKPYNFMQAVSMWANVILRKRNFFDLERGPASQAVICSVLYADSYNEATRRCLGEVNGICVPAWLSVSDEFADVAAGWLQIK